MSLTRSIAKNTVIQVLGKFAGTILGLITVAILARYLGQTGYGEFTTVVSFLQFFGILVDFGLTLTMIRMISDATADESKIASNIFTLRLVSGAAFFGLAPIIALALPYPPAIKIGIALTTLSFFSMTLSQVLLGIFQRHLAVHRAALAEVVGRLILLLGVLSAVNLNGGLTAILLSLVAGNFAQFLLSFLFARRFTRIKLAFDGAVWRSIARQSWPIGLSIAFNLVYLKGDVIILSLTRSQAEVGLYGAAYKILDIVTIVPMAFMGLMLPVLTAAWTSGDRDGFAKKMRRAFDFLTMLAVPLASGTFFVAKDVMRFVAGPEFADSGTSLSVLMLAGAAVFWSGLFGHAVVALNLQRKMIWGYATDAAIALALYLLLVPRFGSAAAAWVTVFSEAFIAAATAAVVISATKAAPSFRVLLRSLLASAAMIVILIAATPFHVLIRIVFGATVYFGTMFLIGGISRETISLLRRAPKTV